MFKRILDLPQLDHSFFLFGPRQVGKTSLLKGLSPQIHLDLLLPSQVLDYSKDPEKLISQVEALAKPEGRILIDEIQRLPVLLDVVHLLMERYPKLIFILSGSSARKLRHGAANLLGGRALWRSLHSLNFQELGEAFSLEQVLSLGSLPKIATLLQKGQQDLAKDLLKAYALTYLKEEVADEALVRHLPSFQNFLEIAAHQFGEQINFSDLGRQASLSLANVKEYYGILEDTLLGFFLYPYLKSPRKRLSQRPKFYFFDNGVTRALQGRLAGEPSPQEQGRLFEQWFFQELIKVRDYYQKPWKFYFWRTQHGAEVDLLIEQAGELIAAIECKHKKNLGGRDLSHLKVFQKEYSDLQYFCTSPVKIAEKKGGFLVLPPRELLESLIKL